MDHGIVIWISTTNTNVLQTVVDHIVHNLRQNKFQGSVIGTIEPSQIKRYGGRRGHRDSRIGEKRWRFGIRSERGTVRGSEVRN